MRRNPFDYQHTVTGRLFVDREEEIRKLVARVRSNRNLLLIAPRRLGKSSLLLETFRRLSPSRYIPVYVDVLKTVDEGEVAQRILDALGVAAFGPLERGWLWLQKQVSRHRPAYTLDPETGQPSLVFQRVEAELPVLEDVLQLIEKTARSKRRRVVLAIDEFQTILERDRRGQTAAGIRSVIQHQRNVSYVFSGSKKHVLLGLVEDRGGPFWGQLDVLELSGIPIDHFAPLARRVFRRSRRALPEEVLRRVGALCEDNPRRIQELLAGLYDAVGPPTPEGVDRVLQEQIAAQRHLLEDLMDEVREGPQKRLLLALAREGSAQSIFSAEFVARHKIRSPAAVQSAAAALQKKGILNDRNRFVDPYLFHYLRLP